jgi:hypothetical protein
MENVAQRVTFEAFSIEDGSDRWGVLVTLGNGRTRNLHGFKSEQEANVWIKRDSVAWLKRAEGGQLPPH